MLISYFLCFITMKLLSICSYKMSTLTDTCAGYLTPILWAGNEKKGYATPIKCRWKMTFIGVYHPSPQCIPVDAYTRHPICSWQQELNLAQLQRQINGENHSQTQIGRKLYCAIPMHTRFLSCAITRLDEKLALAIRSCFLFAQV